MGNIGTITSIGKQNAGGNQNNLKLKYINYEFGNGVYDKIGILVDDSVINRATLIDYMAQNGALGQRVISGNLTAEYRSIMCSYVYYRSNSLSVYVAVSIVREFDSETQEWSAWSDPKFYSRGSSDFTISGDFDVID